MKAVRPKPVRVTKPARSSIKPRKRKPTVPAPRDELFELLRAELGL
jgi:hypothetical protein